MQDLQINLGKVCQYILIIINTTCLNNIRLHRSHNITASTTTQRIFMHTRYNKNFAKKKKSARVIKKQNN